MVLFWDFLQLILFIVFLIVALFIPGKLVLQKTKLKLTFAEDIFISTFVGIIVFIFVYYLLSWLHLTIALYPLIIFSCYLYWKSKPKIPKIEKSHKKSLIFVLVLAILFSFQAIFNGNILDTMYFFGDDMAHLAYISELKNTFPPQHPGFAGIPLRGYHFFSDFLIAVISNTTKISQFNLYFHFMPLLISFGWALGAYCLLFAWTKRVSSALWGVFLVFFGGSFSYLLLIYGYPINFLLRNFGIDQPISALRNQPFSLSVVIILACLLLILKSIKTKSTILSILIGLIVGIAAVFKVYAGILLITALLVLTVIKLVKKNFDVLITGITALIVFCSTFLSFAGQGAGIFYLPFWPLERLFSDFFPTYNYKDKIENYTRLNVTKGLIQTHFETFFVYVSGNLGTRIVGIILAIIFFLKTKKLPSAFSLILISMILVSLFLPLFFAQTINVFDMIQMHWYFLMLASILAANGLGNFSKFKLPKPLNIAFYSLIIILTIPGTIYFIYAKTIPVVVAERQSLDNNYYKSMKFLQNNGSYSDTVIEIPLNREFSNVQKLISWYHTSSAHIAGLGNHRMYLGNQFITFPNMPLHDRLSFLAQINKLEFSGGINKKENKAIINKMKAEKIKYIYAKSPLKIFENINEVKIVFSNPEAVIYEVN